MKKEVGVWIDYKQAVIVINLDQEEEIRHVTSGITALQTPETPPPSRFSESADDQKDKTVQELLNSYYEEVVSYLQGTTSILILGPDDAKTELQKYLQKSGLGEQIIGIITSGEMIVEQLTAEFRQRFFRPELYLITQIKI